MPKKKRVAILGIWMECNAFAKVFTRLDFEASLLLIGDRITDDVRSENPTIMREVSGFYQGMDETGNWQPVPILIAGGRTGGPADAIYVDELMTRTCQGLKAAMPVDGVYIANHGAMTTTEDDDPDGELYERVREVVGPDIPIVASLDLHANVSQRMIDSVNTVVSYRCDPHTDRFERGQETAHILREIFDGMQPVTCNIRLPIVPPNVSLFTADGPYGDLVDYGQSRAGDEVLNVSVVAGFAFSDTSVNGLHVIVTARNDARAARKLCVELAEMAWANRHRFIWDLMSIDDAVDRAIVAGKNQDSPAILLCDLGDNMGAGSPGNTLWMLDKLYNSGANGVLIGGFCDPDLVARAYDKGVGVSFEAIFQGDDWQRDETTFHARVKVRALHGGTFVGRLGINKGKTLSAGRTCLLEVGELLVIVSTLPLVCSDPRYVEMMGVDLTDVHTLVVKARGSFKVAFVEYIKVEDMLFVDTKGRTSPVLTRYPWKNLPRPVLPIDPDTEWTVPDFLGE